MLPFTMVVGTFLASLAGFLGAVLGATPAAKAADAREAKLAPMNSRVDGSFSTYEIAVLMR